MPDITKALNDLAKAVESNDTVAYVKITISLKKPKQSKSNKASKDEE